MKKINQKVLSLPPYISTSWKNINTLHVKEAAGLPTLVIVLHNGSVIEIPNIDQGLVQQVFDAHGKFLEQEALPHQPESLKSFEPQHEGEAPFSFGIPFRIGAGTEAMDNFGSMLQHNQEQCDAPNLPPEVIQKITSISKALGMDLEQMNIPKAEPHCNCVYCQIARAIHAEPSNEVPSESEEEEISEEDLKFRDWEIIQKGDNLYDVVNPLDHNEHYQVFLGKPVGCTCGQKNCEHIRTVLNS